MSDPSKGSRNIDRTVAYPVDLVLAAARRAVTTFRCIVTKEQPDHLECTRERGSGGEKVTVHLSANDSETRVEIKTGREFWFQLPFGQENWSTPIFDAMIVALEQPPDLPEPPPVALRWPTAGPRKGFWWGAGVGVGSAGIRCGDCGQEQKIGVPGYIRLGWTLNERLLAGAEFALWSKTVVQEEFKTTTNLYSFAGTLTYYPSATSGFFVRGGAGASGADVDFKVGKSTVTVDVGSGPGWIAGAGVDLGIREKFLLTTAIDFRYGQFGDLRREEPASNTWKLQQIEVTVGLTFP